MKDILFSYHPTTVIMVDDSTNFLKSIIAVLDSDNFFYKPFNNQALALKFLEEFYSIDNKHKDEILSSFNDKLLFSTYKSVYDFYRFTNISALLIDYEMPGINGLDFCKIIREKFSTKCIMLTGVATSALAIKAINDKLISAFIKKSDHEFSKNVINILNQCAYNFFKLKFDFILNEYKNNYCSFLSINSFKMFFNEVILSKNPCEYYLLDDNGSYLLLSETGKVSAVFAWNNNAVSDIYENFRGKFDLATVNKLMSGKEIICYPYKTEKIDFKELSIFIYPAVQYNNEISYVFIEDADYFINRKYIISYYDYKDKISFPNKHFQIFPNF